MGYAEINAVGLLGVQGHPVTVETHIDRGIPKVALSGLPDTVLAQARDRVRSAVVNSGFSWPDQRIAVNLLPASLPKYGSGFDLAIALAVLVAGGQLPARAAAGVVLIGELGLNGQIRPVRGVLPALLAAASPGITTAIVPPENLGEAAVTAGLNVRAAATLRELVTGLTGGPGLIDPGDVTERPPTWTPDLADVVGQEGAKRAVEIAAAGGHNMLLIGPPGAGKTMLAERLPPLLPRLDDRDAVEVTAIHSIAGRLDDHASLIRTAPFQAPHHSASMPALIGGGSGMPRPGAMSLAHRGVLFLDEVPEFRRQVLDALRQPLEQGEVVIGRTHAAVRFPARVQLILAANPCPCAAAKPGDCECRPAERRRYLGRVSGPLKDRIDIQINLLPVTKASLLGTGQPAEPSRAIAERVRSARAAAAQRWTEAGFGSITNTEVSGARLRSAPWRLSRKVTDIADWMLDAGRLTARGYDRVLRAAWSVADLAGRSRPDEGDLAEAAELRLGHALLAPARPRRPPAGSAPGLPRRGPAGGTPAPHIPRPDVHTAHRTPHTAHRTPHTAHRTPHTDKENHGTAERHRPPRPRRPGVRDRGRHHERGPAPHRL